MRESAFWKTVRPRLAGLDPVRVENACAPGTPDVNCTLGWIELKIVPAEKMPKRATTDIKIPHFTVVQRIWLDRRTRSGGKAWLLLRVDKEWLLFDGTTAAQFVGRCPLEHLRKIAHAHWPSAPTPTEFQDALRA